MLAETSPSNSLLFQKKKKKKRILTTKKTNSKIHMSNQHARRASKKLKKSNEVGTLAPY